MPSTSFSGKGAARALLLLNLFLLFVSKGGRSPWGLAVYQVLSPAALCLALDPPFSAGPAGKALLLFLTAGFLSTLMNLPDPKGWVHFCALLAHAFNFFSFLSVLTPAFARLIFAGLLAGSGLIAAYVVTGEILGYAEFGASAMSANPMNLYPTTFPNQNLDADFLSCGILILALYLMAGPPARARKRFSAGLLLYYLAAGALSALYLF